MAKAISQEKLKEYEELKKFFSYWLTHIRPIDIFGPDHPGHPINCVEFVEKKYGISKSLAGLKQAINDIVEDSQDFSVSLIREADHSLSNAGILTLTEIIRRQSRQYKSILRRAKIRNDTEFYIITSILADTTLALSDSEVNFLNTLVSGYESSKV